MIISTEFCQNQSGQISFLCYFYLSLNAVLFSRHGLFDHIWQIVKGPFILDHQSLPNYWGGNLVSRLSFPILNSGIPVEVNQNLHNY
jgi:hypothetical protein